MTRSLLEIIMPVRNPGSVLSQTVASLTSQTDRAFSVLISDNWSTKGHDILEEAERTLSAAGIPVRRVKPPIELKRVEHWNWAHNEGQAEWLKPLFVGDLLQPAYVERVNERIRNGTKASIIRCLFELRSPEGTVVASTPFTENYLTPRDFLLHFPIKGNWLGSPINICYNAAAWRAMGGYAVHFPACADYGLYVRLALERGLEVIHENLAVFQLHDQRFSHGITKRRVNGFFELWLILREARNYCVTQNLPWPANGVRTPVWQQLKAAYWQPLKRRIKKLVSGRHNPSF